jgi:hypothetical protein
MTDTPREVQALVGEFQIAYLAWKSAEPGSGLWEPLQQAKYRLLDALEREAEMETPK